MNLLLDCFHGCSTVMQDDELICGLVVACGLAVAGGEKMALKRQRRIESNPYIGFLLLQLEKMDKSLL